MPTALPLHGASPSVPRVGPAIAAKGFRVFFLAAALYAVATLPLWLLALFGRFDPSGYLDPVSWHSHEMLFGFAVAVIAGFLLTAVGNWTSRETLVGAPLLGLAALSLFLLWVERSAWKGLHRCLIGSLPDVQKWQAGYAV